MIDKFVRALGVAAKQAAGYPTGHPAVTGSLAVARRLLSELTASGGALVLGIARDGLLYGEQKLTGPQAQELAKALYESDVALLRLEPAVETAELHALLRCLALEARRGEGRLAEDLAAAGARHIHVEAIDYSALRGGGTARTPTGSEQTPGALWDGILRAMLSGKRLADAGEDVRSAAGIARLLEAQAREESVEGVSTRLAEAVAEFLSTARGRARAPVAHQVAELLTTLSGEMRRRLLARAIRVLAGAEEDDALPALQIISSAVPAQEMTLALRRVKSEGFGLSPAAQQLLKSLDAAPPPRPAAAPPAPALDLAAALSEEDADRFHPEGRGLTGQVSIELPPAASDAAPAADAGDRLASLMDEPLTEGLSDMLAELLDRTADLATLRPRVEGTYRALLGLGKLERAAQLAEVARTVAVDPRRPPEARAAAEACLGALAGPDYMSPLVDALQQTSASAAVAAQRLLEALGLAVVRTFLLALAEETDKARRRRLLDLLGAIGLAIVPDAVRLLSDDRWYVVRNMVLLLRTVGDRTSLEDVRRLALHTDLRVRLEAIKTLLEFHDESSRELLETAINDPDPELSEAAIELTGQYAIAEAREPLLALLGGSDLRGRHRGARLKALRALGDLADPDVLPRLRRFFEEPLLPLVAIEERRAAFRTLEVYPPAARRPWIEGGLTSRDALIRSICWRIFRLDSPEPSAGEAPA